MKNVSIDLVLTPSEEARICMDCPEKRCHAHECKRFKEAMNKLKGGTMAAQENTIKKTITAMIDKFGENSQIDVAIEEMSELIKELVKYKQSKIHFREKQASSREHVVEEIGDVMFMMEYLKKIFGISKLEIEHIILEKAKRTKERYLDCAKDN